MLSARTLKIIEQLSQFEWFQNVGRDENTDDVFVLSSWKSAAEHVNDMWSDTKLDRQNELTSKLFRLVRDRYNKHYREAHDETIALLEPIIRRNVDPILARHKLPDRVGGSIWSDLQFWCMESEFVDVVPPAFYHKVGEWYLRGHFPCGWDEDFEPPRLVIY